MINQVIANYNMQLKTVTSLFSPLTSHSLVKPGMMATLKIVIFFQALFFTYK
jgi:hypothetical protein